ncbi:MAG: sugar ABC transporter ATP-binding protein [Desulfobacterales bacterium]|nr:sugar ABC transporter ATP-binding protein [Desulfobacterales bacterium]
MDSVNLEVYPGEIHALVGENGAGKSTLMRIISGASSKDSGSMQWRGSEVDIKTPIEAQNLGIAMIHQELALIPYIDIGKNIFLGREPQGKIPGLIDWSNLYQASSDILDSLGLNISPRTIIKDLSIAQQQMIEVAKSLSMDASLLVMDEPTSALTDREVETLFEQMSRLRSEGVSIIFISHRLEEVYRVADKVTVLRDGRWIGTHPADSLSENEIVKMMVGRELVASKTHESHSTDVSVLRLNDVHTSGIVRGVSLDLKEGEILGIAGLVGAGRTELLEAIFGVRHITQGQILLEGEQIELDSPSKAIHSGVGFVPEDRKAQGLFLNMGVRQNIVLAALDTLTRLGIVLRTRANALTSSLIKQLDIRPPNQQQRVRNLSGGNQQKVVIARWLALEPRVLLLDEPTRGIDVGAKSEIHALLDQMAKTGVAILMVSSELPEILSVCDRILVMREGRLMLETEPDSTTQDEIMRVAAGTINGNNR